MSDWLCRICLSEIDLDDESGHMTHMLKEHIGLIQDLSCGLLIEKKPDE